MPARTRCVCLLVAYRQEYHLMTSLADFFKWSTVVIKRCIALISVLFFGATISADEYLTGIEWQEPKIIQPSDDHAAPSDAIVLFDGKDLSAWANTENWKVEDGVAIAGKGDIRTKQAFGDCQLHIEWSAPTPPTGKGQGRANSGVFLMNTYEIQVLDSYENKTYFDGQAGGIYKQTPPLVNATRPPGQWNVYDIIWTAPKFKEDGSLESPAYITAIHNDVLILNHFELLGDTPYDRPPAYKKHADKLPIRLQDHGNPVRFRNIWVREIQQPVGKQVKEPFIRDNQTGEERPVQAAE